MRKRALQNLENLSHGTKKLQPLKLHDVVQVQNQIGNYPSRWDITGEIVEVKTFDQYVVKIHGSGRMTTRNRKFLKLITPYGVIANPSNKNNLQNTNQLCPQSESDHSSQQRKVQDQAVEDDPIVTQHEELESSGDCIAEDFPSDQMEGVQEEPRRSQRLSRPPERLSIESWKGQSYDQKNGQINLTTIQSFCSGDYISPVLSDGGGGIYDV